MPFQAIRIPNPKTNLLVLRGYFLTNGQVRVPQRTICNMASEKMRVFGGLRAFYYLQTLLTGDNETGRNPAQFHTRGPLGSIPIQTQDRRKNEKTAREYI